MSAALIRCQDCNGLGIRPETDVVDASPTHDHLPCLFCGGTGYRQAQDLYTEIQHLRERLTEMQQKCTAHVIQLRNAHEGGTKLRGQVTAFHHAMDLPVFDTPSYPLHQRSTQLAKLRVELILEEAFEFAAAVLSRDITLQMICRDALAVVKDSKTLIYVDCDNSRLPEIADALADLDYVVEGSRLTFGIDGGPVADEVHRVNMTKVGGPISPSGKRGKPPGFTPPDIARVLREQGWKP